MNRGFSRGFEGLVLVCVLAVFALWITVREGKQCAPPSPAPTQVACTPAAHAHSPSALAPSPAEGSSFSPSSSSSYSSSSSAWESRTENAAKAVQRVFSQGDAGMRSVHLFRRSTPDPSMSFVMTLPAAVLQHFVAGRIFYHSIFAPVETALFYNLLHDKCIGQPPPLVVDVGANLGWFTLLASSLGCRVMSFEPNIQMYPLLQTSFAINEFGHRVRFHPYAIGKERGQMRLVVKGDWGNSEIAEEGSAVAGQSSFAVEVVPLREMVKEDVLLLKIDVEGFEGDVFRGAEEIFSRYHVHTVICEVKPNQDIQAKRDFFEARIRDGYEVFGYQEQYLKDENFLAPQWRLSKEWASATPIRSWSDYGGGEDYLFTRDPDVAAALRK